MRLPRPMRIALAVPVVSLALGAMPALANGHGHDGPPPPPPPPVDGPPAYHGQPHPAHARPSMAPEARSSWVAECQARAGKHRKRYAADYCESYLDDYYARYSAPQPYYGHQGGYGAAYGYPGYAAGCCNAQPMMLVPIVRVQQPQRECKEVVEYEYVDVPVRAAPRRPAPDKRVKVVPDKRVQTK